MREWMRSMRGPLFFSPKRLRPKPPEKTTGKTEDDPPGSRLLALWRFVRANGRHTSQSASRDLIRDEVDFCAREQ